MAEANQSTDKPKRTRKRSGRKFHIDLNIGTVAFLLVVIYIMAYIISYIGKDKMAIYEVSQSDIVDSIEGNGLILRKEKVAKLAKDGYVYFFVKDGSRIRKKGHIYAIDTTGRVQTYVQKLIGKERNVSSEEKERITDSLRDFGESFEADEFSNAYDAHMNINHELASYTDTLLSRHRDDMEKVCGKNSYVEVRSKNEGIITFSSDGLEKQKIESVTADLFKNHPHMTELRTKEKMKKGDVIYRVVLNQRWRLMIPVSREHYRHLKKLQKNGKEQIKILFEKDNFETWAEYACTKNKEDYYVVLLFDNYVQRYINQRYLRVKLILSETEGLKIPTSSLVDKDVYKVPLSLLYAGSKSKEKNQVYILRKEKGKNTLTRREVRVYLTDEEFAYISDDSLAKGEVLSDPEKSEKFELEETEVLQGVYVVNRGFTVFKNIVILEKNDDYCIVSAENSEVELYDRIILNGSTAKEGRTIY